jgi:hypothetical protein
VLQSCISSNSGGWVLGEHLLYQIFGVLAHLLPLRPLEGVVALPHVVQDLIVSLAVERRASTEEDVENDSDAPDVALLIVLPLEDFGSDVVCSSILLSQKLAFLKFLTCAEVYYLNLVTIFGVH